MSSKTCILLGCLALCGVMALLGGKAYVVAADQEASLRRLHDAALAMEANATATHLRMLNLRRYEKDFFLTIGESAKQKDYLARHDAQAAAMRQTLAAILDLQARHAALPPELARDVARLPDLLDEYLRGFQTVRAQLDAAQATPQEANLRLGQYKSAIQSLEQIVIHCAETMSQAMATSLRDEMARAEGARADYVVILAGAAAIFVVVILAMHVQLSRESGAIVAYARDVAGGKLDAQAQRPLHGDARQVYDSILAMVESLKATLRKATEHGRQAETATAQATQALREAEAARLQAQQATAQGISQAAHRLEDVVTVLSTASEQLAAQVEQSSRGAAVQSHRVAETATAMEEMAATVMQVARGAAHAADTTDAARRQALEGAGVVNKVVEDMSRVSDQAQELKTDMRELGRQAEGIGQILNVISDIADQTNLLALNAAIEAARAGDAGRGFAVVADEVRKLAEKTMTATKEVGQAVRGIQQGATRNMTAVDAAGDAIAQATALSRSSGQALWGIVDLVERASDQVRAIATAAEEQSAASEEIGRGIEDVRRVSQETADAMRQSAQSVTDLATQGRALQSLVESLKAEGRT